MSGEERAEAYKIADKRYCKETIGPLPGDHDEGIHAAVDAIWQLAEQAGYRAGYRRAVQALRDEAADFTFEEGRDHSFRFAADFLEHRAAAPRNEGAQT